MSDYVTSFAAYDKNKGIVRSLISFNEFTVNEKILKSLIEPGLTEGEEIVRLNLGRHKFSFTGRYNEYYALIKILGKENADIEVVDSSSDHASLCHAFDLLKSENTDPNRSYQLIEIKGGGEE